MSSVGLLPNLNDLKFLKCIICKIIKRAFKSVERNTEFIRGYTFWHMFIWTSGVKRYFVASDNISNYRDLYLLINKKCTFERFTNFVKEGKNQVNKIQESQKW